MDYFYLGGSGIFGGFIWEMGDLSIFYSSRVLILFYYINEKSDFLSIFT